MSKEWVAVAGALFGALAEEGLEEVFPGLGELAWQGELAGTFTALAGDSLAEGKRDAIKSFIKYAYRQVNDAEAEEEISQSDLDAFSDNFDEIPKSEKEKILNGYRNAAPHEFHLVKEFISENSS